MNDKTYVVALLGSRGNLGSRVVERHSNALFELVPVNRNPEESNYFYVDSNFGISHPKGLLPDLIVNLSNFYSPSETLEDISKMETAIKGTSEVISKHISKFQTSVISASTYFQYAPISLQPWSRYSELKKQAQELLLTQSQKTNSKFVDFVLYDNYGGRRRGKFLDRVLDAIENQEQLMATPGEQILNLCHIDDIADAFLAQMRETLINLEISQQVFELKSNYTKTLKEIVSDVNSLNKFEINVNWGALPYRKNEVFELWDTSLDSPTWWKPKIEFMQWLRNWAKIIDEKRTHEAP